MPTATKAFAAHAATTPLGPLDIQRRDPKPGDVEIEILFCGVCHSDLHIARNEWGGTTYPVVPGHEILGRVTRVGDAVSRFKPGDLAAVGCMVDSCRTCDSCKRDMEQFCLNGRDVHVQLSRRPQRRHDLWRLLAASGVRRSLHTACADEP